MAINGLVNDFPPLVTGGHRAQTPMADGHTACHRWSHALMRLRAWSACALAPGLARSSGSATRK